MLTIPLEFAALVAGLRGRAPFADHLFQSNVEYRRYPPARRLVAYVE